MREAAVRRDLAPAQASPKPAVGWATPARSARPRHGAPACGILDGRAPARNLDAALRISTRAEIKHLHSSMQTTFVYVTHDQAKALTLADRIVVMNDGIVQQIGAP